MLQANVEHQLGVDQYQLETQWRAMCRIMINLERLHIIFMRIRNVVVALGEVLAYQNASFFYLLADRIFIDVRGFEPGSLL